jgi:hypothetical protein
VGGVVSEIGVQVEGVGVVCVKGEGCSVMGRVRERGSIGEGKDRGTGGGDWEGLAR